MAENQEQVTAEPVTKETLVQAATTAGENLRQLDKSGLPRTAGVVLLYSRIVDREVPDDPDSLIARDMAMCCMYGAEQNAINQAAAISEGEFRVVNSARVQAGLNRLVENSAVRGDDLVTLVDQTLRNTRALLMVNTTDRGSRIDYLLVRQQAILEARRELQS